jgi:hypothetical protein
MRELWEEMTMVSELASSAAHGLKMVSSHLKVSPNPVNGSVSVRMVRLALTEINCNGGHKSFEHIAHSLH